MDKKLYNKVFLLLQSNTSVKVTFSPVLKAVETEVSVKFQDENEYQLLCEEFESWFYEEGNDKIECGISNHFDYEFYLEDGNLCCTASFIESTDTWYSHNSGYDKSDILTDNIKSLVIKNLGLDEQEFDEYAFEAEIEYECEFKVLHFYYNDKEINTNNSELKIMKKEIENVFALWNINDISNAKISLEAGYIFIIEEPKTFDFIVEVDEKL